MIPLHIQAYIIALFFALIDTETRAQSTLPQPMRDSLWATWSNGSEADTTRLNALHEFAWQGYLYSLPESAYHYFEIEYQFAERRNLKQHMASALNEQGNSFMVRGDRDAALEYMTRALLLYKEIGSMKGIVSATRNIARVYQDAGDRATALEHYMRALEMSENLPSKNNLALLHNDIGVIHQEGGNHKASLEHYDKCRKIMMETDNKSGLSMVLNNMGNVYLDIGNYRASIDHYMRCLKLEEMLGNELEMASSIHNIGTVQYHMGDIEQALSSFNKALAIREKYNDQRLIAGSLHNIGIVHTDLKRFPEALLHFERALSICEDLGAPHGTATTLLSMGNLAMLQGHHPVAIELFRKCLRIMEELEDKRGIASAIGNLSAAHREMGRLDLAAKLGQKAFTLAKEVGNPLHIRDMSESLMLTYKAMGQHREALAMFEAYITIRDSIKSEENQREVIRQEYQYNYAKQALADSLQHAAELAQVENERTIAQLRADRNRNRALAAGGGGLLLVLGGTLWYRADRKRRQERFERDAAQLETQALRSQMNPHFIFNALNSINAYVQQNDQDSASSYLTKFAKVMRAVLENSRHPEVPLAEDLDALRGYMELERMRMQRKFDFDIQVAADIDPEEVMVPPLVVQPFVENAIWHGMRGKDGQGHITLKVERRGGQLVWTIEDDGMGRGAPRPEPTAATPDDAPTKKTSLGTAITRARLDLVQKQHGGKAGFRYVDLPQGTRVEVDMPVVMA